MDSAAVGFWGAYFGTVALLLAGSIAAFARSLHRVALTAALFGLICGIYFAGFLGWLPFGEEGVRWRALAHISALSATILSLMVLAMLGAMRNPRIGLRIRCSMSAATLLVLCTGWLLEPVAALALSSALTMGLAFLMLLVCIRSALRGDRLAWWAVTGVSFMISAIGGLDWIVRDPAGTPLWVHAVSAVSGMAYVSVMATALWVRYSYLIELRDVVTHGPSYDPITRMRSHTETGRMVGLAFFGHTRGEKHALGVIAVSIGNFYALEQFHGRASVNHALFVCASRLRRCVPADVEMGRLGDDGFLLLVRRNADGAALGELARTVVARLSRPVVLTTSADLAGLEAGSAHWVAQAGAGFIVATEELRPSAAIAVARDMSRTAWTYASRVACQDPATGHTAELALAQQP